ncbi:iron-containing alcohol dehydrogenase [Effusibacillus lacus]|uniref:Alcohol dehydrogenase n=1 Tax=Effusibacillus lacus TaxID=1348429 RepID=A0A292YM29_9BACL|nr:iron-containing alcohol dehydrogenase [Effusibacillus lacus]TCS67847.1 alcohol dehydrogenase [Effusibacillus lacus]GAX89823.1 alcohol dehydrogenase [Effusibacillus lacus]
MNLLSRIFQYELPTQIVFGVNAIQELPQKVRKLAGSRVFVVSDPGVEQAGILKKVTDLLAESHITFETFTEVDREPDVKTIGIATGKAKEFAADLVIGVGGGSAQDAAKAVAVMINNEGKITQYAGLDKLPNPGVPIICIPTTAGTGSEVTIWTVISEKENNMKFGIGGKYLAPTLALCDPALTLSLPGPMTAATGIDALTHALESFVNKATQPVSEALSRESMRLIAKSLRKAVAQGDKLEARYDMLLASTIAAMAFNPTRLGLAHALCMPLGGKFKVPHGVANAILLPQVMEFNLVGNLEKFKEIAEIFGENTEGLPLRDAAELSVKAIRQLNRDIGIPAGLREYGVTEENLDYIAREGMTSGNVLVNPRKPTLEDLKEIVRRSI